MDAAPDADIRRCHFFETVLGVCGIAWSEAGISRLQLPEASRLATERRLRSSYAADATAPPPAIERAIDLLQRYFDGEPISFAAIELDLGNPTPFLATVYAATRAIPRGQTLTYGEIATAAGAPGGARAVGQAMARNPVPIVIPCHRVLASGGKPGGFSAFGGAVTKERLLALEGVSLRSEAPLLAALEAERHDLRR